jgi:acetolactate synthase I/II/III large subunit
MHSRSGGRILVEALEKHGVRKVFCVPGESYLDALDALRDSSIRTITCRQEGGAAFMAEAYAKLTGHAGVCFVTRGPGACNAAIGLHTAMQDSTPFVLLVGQVARGDLGRDAFQEIDYRDMFRPPICKWVTQVMHAADLPQAIAQAFDVATSGRPGPVVVALPEDMLAQASDVPVTAPLPPVVFAPRMADIAALKGMLEKSQKPLVIVGGGGWTEKSALQFQDFCARAQLPVATGFRRQDAFDNTHPCYAGVLGTTFDPQLAQAVRDADLIVAVGTRLGEILTQGYTLLETPRPAQKLVHVYPEASELNRVYETDLAIHSGAARFAAMLEGVSIGHAGWAARTAALHGRYLAWSQVETRDKFALDLDGVIADIAALLPEDAIVTTDAGNFSGWAQRYLRYKRPMRLLAPTSGAMGYGVPAAIAASLAKPEAKVVGFMGDGGFMMTGQEIATAVHEGAHPILLVFNNGMYGTIRMHQEKHYPGRVSATGLTNPDFASLARSYGIEGMVVDKTADFRPAFENALASGKMTLIELRMDPQQITTTKKLSELAE